MVRQGPLFPARTRGARARCLSASTVDLGRRGNCQSQTRSAPPEPSRDKGSPQGPGYQRPKEACTERKIHMRSGARGPDSDVVITGDVAWTLHQTTVGYMCSLCGRS